MPWAGLAAPSGHNRSSLLAWPSRQMSPEATCHAQGPATQLPFDTQQPPSNSVASLAAAVALKAPHNSPVSTSLCTGAALMATGRPQAKARISANKHTRSLPTQIPGNSSMLSNSAGADSAHAGTRTRSEPNRESGTEGMHASSPAAHARPEAAPANVKAQASTPPTKQSPEADLSRQEHAVSQSRQNGSIGKPPVQSSHAVKAASGALAGQNSQSSQAAWQTTPLDAPDIHTAQHVGGAPAQPGHQHTANEHAADDNEKRNAAACAHAAQHSASARQQATSHRIPPLQPSHSCRSAVTAPATMAGAYSPNPAWGNVLASMSLENGNSPPGYLTSSSLQQAVLKAAAPLLSSTIPSLAKRTAASTAAGANRPPQMIGGRRHLWLHHPCILGQQLSPLNPRPLIKGVDITGHCSIAGSMLQAPGKAACADQATLAGAPAKLDVAGNKSGSVRAASGQMHAVDIAQIATPPSPIPQLQAAPETQLCCTGSQQVGIHNHMM